MKDILRILLISLLSFTIISCSKKDESLSGSSGSSGSSISLSDIKGNITSNSKYLTTKSNDSSSRNLVFNSTRSSNKNSSSTDSLLTFDENGNIDYGLITNHNFKIDQLINLDRQNAIAIFDYNDVNTWRHIIDLNCGIIKLIIDSTDVSCFIYGIPATSTEHHFQFDADIYGKNPIQKNDNYLYFRSTHTDDNSVEDDLKCSGSCVYSYDLETKQVNKLSKNNISVEKFILLQNNDLIYRGLLDEKRDDGTSIETGIMYISDNSSSEFEIPNTSIAIGDVNNGDHKTLFWSKDNNSQQYSVYFRSGNNETKYSFLIASISEIFTTIKGGNGLIYAHTKDGLYSLLPFNSNPIISKPYTVDNVTNSDDCHSSMLTCNIFFKVLENLIITNYIDYNYNQKPTIISVKRFSDNKTINVVKPDGTCSKNCFQIDNAYENERASPYTKWYLDGNIFYIPMYDLVNKKYTIIKIDINNLDFNKDDNQFSEMSNLDDYIINKRINTISSYIKKANSNSPTAEIIHEPNDNKSVRINFNNLMNFISVEDNINVIDNSSNESITFMPVWNNKTIHLVFDTNIGTTQDFSENTLTTDKTYKITLLGLAKDSDGNTIGSDVIKYITP